MRKPDFCLGENKGADQLRGNREADQRLCFRYSDSTIPLLSKSKSSFLSLYRPVCVGPGRKPRRPVFSRRGSKYIADTCTRKIGIFLFSEEFYTKDIWNRGQFGP